MGTLGHISDQEAENAGNLMRKAYYYDLHSSAFA